ncbi:hypothetical protein LJC26_05785 [Desulfovibrio sp. OttesenSCG-928-O18]|nr:hypothetical protein [Desulfovibrio sp. OttesenSCG-928-O18]
MAKKLNADATSAHKTLMLYTLLLFSGRRHSLTDLAKSLECSKPTVLRLIRTIELAGVATVDTGIEDRNRWFQLASALPSGTPRIKLDAAEMEKLALCRDILEQLLPDSMERILNDAVTKISLLLDKVEERGKVTAPKAIRMTRGYIDYTPFQPFIDCLLQAIGNYTVCAIAYKAPLKEQRVFEVVPVRLMVDGDVLNVEGWRVTDKGMPKIRYPHYFGDSAHQGVYTDSPPT